MNRVIIGCGYLGRRVAVRWLGCGKPVHALTRSAANAQALRDLGIAPLLGDVTDLMSLPEMPTAETVLYAVGLDRRSGKSQHEVYVAGLENVLQRLPAGGRFVYVSSTSVYGQDAGEWVDETSPCIPAAENGKICLEAEQVLRRYRPDAIIIRLAGIYGPGRLIARVAQLQTGVVLEGNPDSWLNLIHIEDAADAVVACEERGHPAATYVGSDNQPIHRRDYYSLLARLVGAPDPQFRPQTTGAAGSKMGKRCSNRRLRDELRVAFRYPTIAEGLPAVLRDDS